MNAAHVPSDVARGGRGPRAYVSFGTTCVGGQGLGFRVQGSGFGVQGSGFRVRVSEKCQKVDTFTTELMLPHLFFLHSN